MFLDNSVLNTNIAELEENIADINVSDADASETLSSEVSLENVTTTDADIKKKELDIVETFETVENTAITETSVSDNLQIAESNKNTFELIDDMEDEEVSYDEIELINDLIPHSYANVTYADVVVASSSNMQGYEDVVVNRLNNILTCTIISACCAFLVLFHTLKKE